MSDAQDAVLAAQQALAAAQARADAEAAAAKAAAAGDSQQAQEAESTLGKAIGSWVGQLIRRVEALEAVAHSHGDSASASAPAAAPSEPATVEPDQAEEAAQ